MHNIISDGFVLHCMYLLYILLLVACEFDSAAYKVDANDGRLQIKLKLDRPATTEFNMQVYDVNNTAIGELGLIS